jgi:hypothetical protein
MSHSLPSLSVQDALDDIDMELLQDAVQRDDLGQSVQNVRRFQNNARKETLDTPGRPDYRAIANRQFQLNDMLLTLLQELSTRQRALELELRMYGHSGVPTSAAGVQVSSPQADCAPAGDARATGVEQTRAAGGTIAGAWVDESVEDEEERSRPASEGLVRRLDAIQAAMRDDALALQLEVTPNETPVVGRLIGNMRAAVHSLVVFYNNQLAARQTEINRVYGGALQQLMMERERDRVQVAEMANQVNALAGELADLRPRLAARDSGGETSQP